MIRLVRIIGFLMMASGGVILVAYAIKPLRALWPWFTSLPLPVQVGIGVAAFGLLVLLGTLIWERLEEREADKALREE